MQKEELMKKVTTSYNDNDLHTLLFLEMEWLNQVENSDSLKSDEQLKIYSSILKKQVDELKEEYKFLITLPEYSNIAPYILDHDPDSPTPKLSILKLKQEELLDDIKEIKNINSKLQIDNKNKLLFKVIKNQKTSEAEFELMDLLDDQLMDMLDNFNEFTEGRFP